MRYIPGNTHPDHNSIHAFRKRFLGELKGLFVQILLRAYALGVLPLGTLSLDGSKVHATASKHQAMSWDYANRLEAQWQAEVEALLQQAEAGNTERSTGTATGTGPSRPVTGGTGSGPAGADG